MGLDVAKGLDKVLSNEGSKVSISDTAFVQDTLRSVYTVERFGSVKAAQTEAYNFLRKRVTGRQLTLRRVRTFFEGKAKAVRGEEKDAVRAAQIEEAKREYQELKTKLARMEAALAVADQAFLGPQMDAYRGSQAEMGAMDRAGTQPGE